MRVYILKPTKEGLKLRKAIAYYKGIASKLGLDLTKTSEARRVISHVKYHHKPEMTEAKNRILSGRF